MRAIISSLLLLTAFATSSQASELQIICPPLTRDGINDLALSFEKETGTKVHVRSDVMGKIIADIDAGMPAPDVVLLPPDLMETLQKSNGTVSNTRTVLGRIEIALAVRTGAPHPDISTVEKLRTVLGDKVLAYTQPGPPRNSMEAGIIDGLMHRPIFSTVRTITIATGSGISALAKGDGEFAMQVIPEINAQKGVELVGPLPPELDAHIDTQVAVSSRSANQTDAMAFIRYITRPDAAKTWVKYGLDWAASK